MVLYEQLYDEILRNHLFIHALPIPGYNRDLPTRGTVLETYNENILLIKKFSDDIFGFINKLKPHSLYDTMLMSLDENPVKSAVTDLQNDTIVKLFAMAYEFLKFVSREDCIHKFGLNNGKFHLCFNYDPDTIDRESGMFEKLFHIHFNYWTETEIDYTLTRKMEALPFSEMRQFIDPLTIIGEMVLFDVLCDMNIMGDVLPVDAKRDVTYGLPDGLKIKYSDWSVMLDANFTDEVQKLHRIIDETYSTISNFFFLDHPHTNSAWQRKKLKNKDEIIAVLDKCTFLSTKTLSNLKVLASLLRDIPINVMDKLKTNKEKRIQMLSVGGLNYSIGMYTHQSNTLKCPIIDANTVYMVIKVKMFSESGGAGILYVEGLPFIKIKRDARQFSNHEVDRRRNFHHEFIDVCFPRHTI